MKICVGRPRYPLYAPIDDMRIGDHEQWHFRRHPIAKFDLGAVGQSAAPQEQCGSCAFAMVWHHAWKTSNSILQQMARQATGGLDIQKELPEAELGIVFSLCTNYVFGIINYSSFSKMVTRPRPPAAQTDTRTYFASFFDRRSRAAFVVSLAPVAPNG